MPTNMISVIIPNYNRRDRLLALLSDIYRQQKVSFEVIVVDDCSCDDSVDAVRRIYPQVRLIVNASNRGPCVARNRGICAALGEFVVGYDSDVTIPDRLQFIKIRNAFAACPSASGLAFRIFSPDGYTDDAPRWWHPVPLACGASVQFETDYFSGTAYAFRRAALINAGLYPEILFMHYEEVVVALHVLDNGGSIIYNPNLSVLHHADKISQRNKIQMFYKPRNQILLTFLCLPICAGVVYLGPRLLYQFVKAACNCHVMQFYRALADVFLIRGTIVSNRNPVKQLTLSKIYKLRKTPANLLVTT